MSATNARASGLATRYATALFELAREKGVVEEIGGDLDRLDAMLDESDDLSELIRSPVVSREEQENAILSLAEKAELRELTGNFLGVLAQKRRLHALPEVVSAYREMLATSRGEVTAEVTAAQKLTDEQQARLKEAVERYVGQGVTLQTRVDESLLGGLVVQVGSRMLDASLKTKLQQLEQTMMRGTR